MQIAVNEKNIVSFIRIFGTLSFPVRAHRRTHCQIRTAAKRHLDRLSRFAQLTVVTDRPTDRQTDHATALNRPM